MAEHEHEHDHDHQLIVDRLPAGRWHIDPDSSEVLFKARTLFGVLPVTGMFEWFSGEIVVDDAGGVDGSLVVETASLDTGIARRDRQLRGSRYFDVERYPQMTLGIERVAPSGQEHLELTGTLTLCGRQIPLNFPVYVIAHGEHLHLEGTVIIDHEVAGLGWTKPGLIGKRVRAEAALTLNPAG